MAARLTAFLVWAALAASALFWGLKLAGRSPVAPPHTVPVADAVVPAGDLSRLFGAAPVAAAAEAAPAGGSRFQLVGVVAPRGAANPAVALIAVDGNPPRPYRVGRTVDGDLTLQGVEQRAASLGKPGEPATVRLELPPPPVAATGTLPPPPGMAGPGAPVAGAQVPPGGPPRMRLPGVTPNLPPGRAAPPQQPPAQQQESPEQAQQAPEAQQPAAEDPGATGVPVR